MYHWRGGLVNKKLGKDILKICLFLAIANLPFITIAQQVGIDVFLDSFENPDYYNYLNDIPLAEDSCIENGDLVIVQRSSHPEFTANEGDIILRYKIEEGYSYNKIYQVNSDSSTIRYYAVGISNFDSETIYEHNIIGRVVGVIDDNIWNSLSITLWKTSINNLNIKAMFSEH